MLSFGVTKFKHYKSGVFSKQEQVKKSYERLKKTKNVSRYIMKGNTTQNLFAKLAYLKH